jgi:hypothetical protein
LSKNKNARFVLVTLVAAAGLVNLAFICRAVWTTQQFFDFDVFHYSAVAWLSGQSPYAVPNLNPPYTVVLMSPLGLLPRRAAWLIWQGANLAMLAITVRLCTRATRPLTPKAWAILLAHASTLAQVQMGQVAWVLGLPIAFAWSAWRQGDSNKTGVWLGLAIAAKPSLLLLAPPMLVDERWRRVFFIALATAGGIVGLTLLVTGPHLFVDWLATRHSAWDSAVQPLNASAAGAAAMAGLPPGTGFLAGAVAWRYTLARWRHLSPDLQWLAAFASTLLMTPLAWVHYLSWLLPPTWAAWRSMHGRFARLAIIGMLIPPVAIPMLDRWHLLYPIALTCWLLAAVLARRRDDPHVVVLAQN